MKRKKGWIAGIVVIAVIVLFFVGYNMYRYPAMFRGLSDNSLNDSQAEELREEILSQSDAKVLVAYFSYSGTTKNVADGIVPVSYSDRAAKVYRDAEYHVIDGAGHGFHGGAFDEAVRYVFAYLQEIRII